MKDLTKGKISTLILGFAIPVFLGNLLQLTYSLADTRIVGSFLGEQSLAAVGATTTISNLIVGFLLGLANGFATIWSRRYKEGSKIICNCDRIRCSHFRSIDFDRNGIYQSDLRSLKCAS